MIELQLDGGRLRTVPAIHYRFAFAEIVNQSFLEKSTRAKAVAVELGQGAVDALVSWLTDLGIKPLGVKPRRNLELPCMLGLIKQNRRIHPDLKTAATQLQEVHGLPLHQLPPRILREELHYSRYSLLCLSATDSIIEAIRCAIEYEVPVYGVDLEEFAQATRKPAVIEDPVSARDDFVAYIQRNALHSTECRDDYVDKRREQMMARRLKFLVQERKDVLFTGGMAHWTSLEKLLHSADQPPLAACPEESGFYERVLVDPAIAIRQMDITPDFTPFFESRRGRRGEMLKPKDIYHLFFEKLKRAYQNAAGGRNGEPEPAGEEDDGEPEPVASDCAAEFFHYLTNMCLVNQQSMPDLQTTLVAASTMVSPGFAGKLGKSLIVDDTDVVWSKPEDYPELPYLHALPLAQEEFNLSEYCQKAELIHANKRSVPFFVAGRSSDGRPRPPIQLDWIEPPPVDEEDEDGGRSHNPWIWPPCENLFYGTAFQAAEIALTNTTRGNAEPFSGSFYNGIDIRATIRASARGDDRIYVRVGKLSPPQSVHDAQTEPFVYIFDRMDAMCYTRRDWEIAVAGEGLDRFIRPKNKDRYDAVVAEKGYGFVACVSFGEDREPEPRLERCSFISSVRLLWGAVGFGNPCLNSIQSARWLEEGDFGWCPVLHTTSSNMAELVRMYTTRHRVRLDLENWAETLVRIAIPYARERIVVIAPDPSAVSSRARLEARSRRISLDVLPLSYFAAERLAAIRRQYTIYPKNDIATEWSQDVTRLLGQSSDAHFDILPKWVREQTRENS